MSVTTISKEGKESIGSLSGKVASGFYIPRKKRRRGGEGGAGDKGKSFTSAVRGRGCCFFLRGREVRPEKARL